MMTVAFEGREQVSAAQVIILAGALRLYLRTGMKPNRAYTPTNMRAAASRITGVEYPRGRKGLELASEHLDTIRAMLLNERRASLGLEPKVFELWDPNDPSMKGAKPCDKCRAPIMAPELAPSEPERCERCAD